jgi:hypothetical protein
MTRALYWALLRSLLSSEECELYSCRAVSYSTSWLHCDHHAAAKACTVRIPGSIDAAVRTRQQ